LLLGYPQHIRCRFRHWQGFAGFCRRTTGRTGLRARTGNCSSAEGVAAGNNHNVSLLQGSGDALPFADNSFDAVSEFSTLHHVADPNAVVKEMLRVARKTVVLVDSNRFGQGSLPARLFKLFLYKINLWNAFNFIRTRGKRYQISDGDGLFYSYSVYDSYDLLMTWADRVLALPTGTTHGRGWFHPLLTSSGVMLIAIREPREAKK
jgi:SAM-dependent methyltransferase